MNDQLTTQEEISSKTKAAIIDEAKRIEENCQFTAKGHFETAQFWSKFHLWIGVPSFVLAGIAGAFAFAKFEYSNILSGILSLIVVVLTSIATFLNPKDESHSHLSAGNNYDSLLTRVRIFWTIDCRGKDSDSILTSKLKDFSDEKDKLNRECPQVPKWAYNNAKKGIEAGEATYKVDKK